MISALEAQGRGGKGAGTVKWAGVSVVDGHQDRSRETP